MHDLVMKHGVDKINLTGDVAMDALLDLVKNNLMVILGFFVGGLIGLLVSHREIGKIIRMARTSTGEIGSLPMDEQVEVVGSADGGAVIESPITKKPCVLWQIEVKELRKSGKSSHWVTVYSNKSTTPFDVYDVSGRVRVQPGSQTELLLRDDEKQSSSLFSALDEQTQKILGELGINTKGLLNMNKRMQVYERYIEKGDQIYALGRTTIQNGTKTIDGNTPLIVSDQSELRLLTRYIWQVVMSALIGAAIGAVIFLSFMGKFSN
jgi:hypothetical protein